jgi:hypothetical protein
MELDLNRLITWSEKGSAYVEEEQFEIVEKRGQVLTCLTCGTTDVNGVATPYRIYGDSLFPNKDRLNLSIEFPHLHESISIGQFHLDMPDEHVVGLIRMVKEKNRETTAKYKRMKVAYYKANPKK